MAIPSLDSNGLLPGGIHDCKLDEIRARFGSFQMSDRRPKLFEQLVALVTELKSAAISKTLLIDGSFITSKNDPNDIDLVLLLAASHDFAADLSPAQYNVVSRRRVQSRYGFDIVIVREGTIEFEE